MAKGLFITFEGTEGCGKSTQIKLLADRLTALGHRVRLLREPGGTPIGEEIRHTLKHSQQNHAMTAEAELLLMNASRAQLVREIIRPALAAGEIVLCDRFYDSTTAYQGHGRGLDLARVKTVIEFAVGDTRPQLTLLLHVPAAVSAGRLRSRQSTLPFVRDRIEEADQAFFERVAGGFQAIAHTEPQRVKILDAHAPVETVCARIWDHVQTWLPRAGTNELNVVAAPAHSTLAESAGASKVKPDTMIENTIGDIEAKIHGAKSISDERRQELLQLLGTLKSEVATLAKTHDEQAESIAGFAQLSTHEATRAKQNAESLDLSIKGLRSSVDGFEQSHPKLVQIVNSISNTLASLGI